MTKRFGKDVNRLHKVPAINDNGFMLSESVAIFHYLGRKGSLTDRWYPSDLKALTSIDEYLQWQHNNLTIGAGMTFRALTNSLTNGAEPSAEEIELYKRTLIKSLDDLECIWLKDNKFLVGDEVTFADLMAASLLEQVVGTKLYKLDEKRHPKTKCWFDEVRKHFGVPFIEAHQFVYKVGERISKATQ